ncbi:hypothetical protein MJO28_015284 [Puccinia striiformis f. sp. tritici]|uniref:Uncharacterized protein n=1 Tax=Puccinia striiformis f. sp. tritici TaxID=168172 RepID=A0ACC0DU48_9BASI|nr:hypothetical protein MJO28_015284 [Puccinia striiformis f. sp. tritici]
MAGLKRPTQGAEDANKRKLSWFKHLHPLIKDQIPTSKGFFTVFANTSQLVPNFPPKSLERDPGLRCIKLGQKLFPPIYRIGMLDLMVRLEPKSGKELVSPLRLSSYGSPFYGLYFEKALKTTPDIAINDNLMTAYSKLLCTLTIPPPHEDLTEAQIFALLGSTIQAQHSSSDFNSELISNHAAHCTFINSSQKVIVAHYPLQFVYASAANTFLASSEHNLIACINSLSYPVIQLEIRGCIALERLINSAPKYILKLHEPDSKGKSDLNTIKWAKHLSPMFHQKADGIHVYPTQASTCKASTSTSLKSGHHLTDLPTQENAKPTTLVNKASKKTSRRKACNQTTPAMAQISTPHQFYLKRLTSLDHCCFPPLSLSQIYHFQNQS